MTGLGIARGLRRLRRAKQPAVIPAPIAVPQDHAADVAAPEPLLTAWEASRLAALAEELAQASPGAAYWGELFAGDLRAVLPDRVADADAALVLLQVAAGLDIIRESQEDDSGALMAFRDAVRLGAGVLAGMELALLATEQEGRQ